MNMSTDETKSKKRRIMASDATAAETVIAEESLPETESLPAIIEASQ